LKKELILSALVMTFLGASPAFAGMENTLVLCKSKKNVRTLRVEVSEDQKCRAIYTKQGVDETIGSNQFADCDQYITNVRKNLEEAKWNCREVKEARTSMVNIGAE
jgi:hypothetical protein